MKWKLCGLSREQDVICANEVGPDYAGFVLYPPSRRYVNPAQLRSLRALLRPQIPAVGVFVDERPETVAEYLNAGLIQIAQLHGSEDEDYLAALRRLAPGCQLWKAFQLAADKSENRAVLRQAASSSADMVLLDSGKGSGRRFDWQALAGGIGRPYLLAGGLDAGNAAEAVRLLHPWCLDLSSGLETEGAKDPEKIRAFAKEIERLRL